MEFLHPEALYFMLVPLVILFTLLLTQQEREAEFFDKSIMERLRVSANTLTMKARNALMFLASFLVLIALSSPVIMGEKVEVKSKSVDIMLALDISDSMLAKDLYPNRLESAKQKMLHLLQKAPNERIGVSAFAKNAYLVAPLSFDHSVVSFLLSKLQTNSITEKGTDFLTLLEVVANSSKNEKKYVMLFSDGGDKADFSKEIAFAKEHNIVVYVLAVATQKGAPIEISKNTFIKQNGSIIISKLNKEISSLATQTGGAYIQSVNSNKDVDELLKELLHSAQKKVSRSEEIQQYTHLFYYPLTVALLLLLIAMSSLPKLKKSSTQAVLMLFSMFVLAQPAHSGMLDFLEFNEAKKAYEHNEYDKAQKIYSQKAIESHNPSVYYNNANALYKQKKYKEAIASYEKAVFNTSEQNALKYANIANAYAYSNQKGSLENAKQMYEKSLKLKEDKDVEENLEMVKKLLEKQKKKEQKKQNNKQKNDKKQNKNEQNKNEQNKKNNQQNKNDKQKDSQQKNEKQTKSEKQKEKDAKENQQNKQQQEKNKEKQKEKNSAQKKDDKKLKELKNQEQNSTKKSAIEASMKKQMSDAEMKKWLKQLNKNTASYMYRLNKSQNTSYNGSEKPW